MYKIKNVIDLFKYDIPSAIKQIIYWFPVIVKIKWWDGGFLLQLIEHQLKQMENNWHKSHYIGWEDDYYKIVNIRNAVTRLKNDKYLEESWESHNNKYGKVPEDFESLTEYFNREQSKEEQIEFTRLSNGEELLKQLDYDRFKNNIVGCLKMWD